MYIVVFRGLKIYKIKSLLDFITASYNGDRLHGHKVNIASGWGTKENSEYI